jgi:hypothetical protein
MPNQNEFEYCNIDKWRSKGYTGKGITIWSFENNEGHGANVYSVLKKVAPDADIICRNHHSIGLSISNGEIIGGKEKLDAYFNDIVKSGASITTDSSSGIIETLQYVLDKFNNQLKPSGIISFVAAGNDGSDGLLNQSKPEEYIAVGACKLSDVPIRESFSAIGKELDVMGFEGGLSGTSFASPFVAGMMALYHQWFKENYNKLPTYQESRDFLYANLYDLDIPGFDSRTGYGLFRLPEEIPEVKSMEIKLKIDSPDVYVDGVKETLDAPAKLINGRTYVPLRFISEKLGATVGWNGTTKEVTIKL